MTRSCSSKSAKKKRNLAFSRVTKCLIGAPLAEGEPPMLRVRAAWRARILEPTEKHAGGTALEAMDRSEEAKAKMWPNRCVAELVAFTDTLEELGEMNEAEKDLGYYSRNLSKETAGDNWQNAETYKTALEDFFNEAKKGEFEVVDVPDVSAPALVEAKNIDELAGDAWEGARFEVGDTAGVVRFYAPAGKGQPEQLCVARGEKELRCRSPVEGGLPPEASGVPWILPAGDAAEPLLAFGRHGVAEGRGVSTGVYRGSFRLVPPDKYYVAGGWSDMESASALLKAADDPTSDRFEVHTVTSKQVVPPMKITLEGWDGEPAGVALFGFSVFYSTRAGELARMTPGQKPVIVAKLPGPLGRFHACRIRGELFVTAHTVADGISRVLVTYADKPFGPNGVAIVENGEVACGSEALAIKSASSVTTCAAGACVSKALAAPAPIFLDDVSVSARAARGLFVVTASKDGAEIARAVYDAQMKGRDVTAKSRLSDVVATYTGCDFALVQLSLDDKTRFVQIDVRGAVSPVKIVKE